MVPLYIAIPVAILESATFYAWNWPHRALLPKQFRTAILSKGIFKSLIYVGITALLSQYLPMAAWIYAGAHPILGLALHLRWCRKNEVHPITVQLRARYVLGTTIWLQHLVAQEEERNRQNENP
ncbi:hypothetical protein KAI87_03160 [Myxococcota bacterium]|nr:hypothetical protein [Myxococcota bacterium]